MMTLKLKRSLFVLLTICCLLIGSSSIAGNPLYMNLDNTPLTWDTSKTIKFKLDSGGLGKLSYAQSLALVQEAMAVWEQVSGTGIKFEYLGPTDEEITVDNWKEIAANHIYAEGYNTISPATTDAQINHYIVIGFDNTGEIVEAKGSPGASGVQSHTGVLGTYEDPQYFISAHLFINGLYYNGDNSDIADLSMIDIMAILVHELGHALGLDHNVTHYQIYRDILNGAVNPNYARYMHTMFPRFIKGSGQHMITLHPDEIATLKWMYGSNDVYTISGNVYDAKRQEQYSMLVTARDTSSSLCHSYSQATRVTCADMNTSPSGKGANYFNAKNCMDDDVEGYYIIPTLYQGEYTIDVSEIPAFLTTSIAKFGSVIQEMPGSAEFYNDDDGKSENNYDFDEIVIDGDDEYDVDIVLSSTVSTSSQLDRIEYSYFEEDDFFQVLDFDDTCPASNNFDIESIVNNAVTSSSVSSTGTVTNDSSGSASCSLNTEYPNKTSHTALLLLAFIGVLTILSRLLSSQRIPRGAS